MSKGGSGAVVDSLFQEVYRFRDAGSEFVLVYCVVRFKKCFCIAFY